MSRAENGLERCEVGQVHITIRLEGEGAAARCRWRSGQWHTASGVYAAASRRHAYHPLSRLGSLAK